MECLKNKWNSLVETFKTELKVKKSKWKYFEKMIFLKEIYSQNIKSKEININNSKIVLRLIEEIKSRPEIWNNSLKDSHIRNKLWNEIAQNLGLKGTINL